MTAIERLVGCSRSALRHLEQTSASTWPLFQAETVLVPHRCSAIASLLTPFSLNDDAGLRHAVARGDATPAPVSPHTTPSVGMTPSPAGEDTPLKAPFSTQPRHRRTVPALPAGCDFPRSQQLVRSLLDRLGAEQGLLASAQDPGSQTSPAPGPRSGPARASSAMPSPSPSAFSSKGWSTPSGSRPKTGGMFAPGDATDETATAPLADEARWLDRHPAHQTTAGKVVVTTRPAIISESILKEWASAAQTIVAPGNASPEHLDATSKMSTTVPTASFPVEAGRQPHQPHQAVTPASQAASTSMTTDRSRRILTETSSAPLAPEPASWPATPAISQLELLVRKWQEHYEVPMPPAAVATEDDLQHKGTVVPTTPRAQFLSGLPPRSDNASIHTPFFGKQTDELEADQVFAATLGRVLKREIRRHGLEEMP